MRGGREGGEEGRREDRGYSEGKQAEQERDMLTVCFDFIYRGQYSDAVLSELENQNDQHLEGISAKVKMLKDVCFPLPRSLPGKAL